MFATSAILHGGPLHFLMNMLGLMWLGPIIVNRLGVECLLAHCRVSLPSERAGYTRRFLAPVQHASDWSVGSAIWLSRNRCAVGDARPMDPRREFGAAFATRHRAAVHSTWHSRSQTRQQSLGRHMWVAFSPACCAGCSPGAAHFHPVGHEKRYRRSLEPAKTNNPKMQDDVMRLVIIPLLASVILHVIGFIMTGFAYTSLFLLFPAGLYSLLSIGLWRGINWVVWVTLICMAGGMHRHCDRIFWATNGACLYIDWHPPCRPRNGRARDSRACEIGNYKTYLLSC